MIVIKKYFRIFVYLIIVSSFCVGLYFTQSEFKEYKKSLAVVNNHNSELKNRNEQLEDGLNLLKAENDELSQRIAELEATKRKEEEEALKEKNRDTGKSAYLTFDDGPSANTLSILKTLKDNNIKATFFVNGYPDFASTYKQIVDEGHLIANHTYSHDYSSLYSSVENFYCDVDKLNSFLAELGVPKPAILRFPGGSNNTVSHNYGGQAIMDHLTQSVVDRGYQYLDWNVSSGDAAKATVEKETIVSNVTNGANGKESIVVLFHDSKTKTTTAEALPEIIANLKAQGYTFKLPSHDSPIIHFK